jgi:hypothetical protein
VVESPPPRAARDALRAAAAGDDADKDRK